MLGQSIIQQSPQINNQPAFIENRGQWSSQTKFMAEVNGMNVWITDKGMVYDVYSTNEKANSVFEHRNIVTPSNRRSGQVISMEFENMNKGIMVAQEQQSAYRNYFIGNNRDVWKVNVPTFNKVTIREIYKGIDVLYSFQDNMPRYDFIVHPGADPNDITLRFQGADSVRVNEKNGLQLSTNLGDVVHGNIYAFQQVNGKKVPICCLFQQQGDIVKFVVGKYDNSTLLVIDPLVYSAYLGGSGMDEVNGVKLDSEGNIVVVGATDSPNFPTVTGAYTYKGSKDAFITKYEKATMKMLFSTYFGGSSDDIANALAIDKNNSIYITGETTSGNLPITPASWKLDYSGGTDVFATRLDANGTTLLYSTYIGGSKNERAVGVCVDEAGNATICGETNSSNFPTSGANAYQGTLAGQNDGFITKLRPNGSGIVFSTYFGGGGNDRVNAVDTDPAGLFVYIGGETDGGFTDVFPPISSSITPYNNKFNAGNSYDGFVGKMSSAGLFAEYSKHFLTYIGDAKNDKVISLALLSTGEVAVGGETEGGQGNKGFPVSNGNAQSNGGTDCFVSKLNSIGSALVASFMFGGGGDEGISALTFCANTGDLFAVGYTKSSNFPLAISGGNQQPEKSVLGGVKDGFVSRLSSSIDRLSYSSYFGGSNEDAIKAVTVTPRGDVIFAGYTLSGDLPIVNGEYKQEFGGNRDGFLSKIAFGSLSLSTPNNGNVFCPDGIASIEWSKYDGLAVNENINIDISADSGKTWTVLAKNISGVKYQWKIPADQATGTSYKIKIYNPDSGINDVSDGTFSVGIPSKIIEQPTGDSVCIGARFSIRVKGEGTNLTYKWFFNGTEIKNETKDSLVIESVQEKDKGNYTVEVNAGCQPKISSIATLSLRPKTEIHEQPVGGNVEPGKSFTFMVTATGASLGYEWQHNSIKILNADSDEYTISTASDESKGQYRVIVWGECGADTSISVNLTVMPVGVDELVSKDEDYILLPNPASDKLLLSGNKSTVKIELFTMIGMQVVQKFCTEEKCEIDVSAIENGVYMAVVEQGGKLWLKPILVIHR